MMMNDDLILSLLYQHSRAQCVLMLPDAGVSVFKFSITRDTECCRVATRSFLITLGCFSVIVRFSTQSG